MTAVLDKLEKENRIDQQDFDRVAKLVYHSFLINIETNYKSNIILDKKEELLVSFSQFLEKYLELQFLNSKKDKLELINFIDKMNMQKELLELQKNETNISQIQEAGQRLGKKSQSAFSSK